MNVLIIGSGGREHALAWKAAQSPLVKKLYCAPGNSGALDIAENVPIEADNIAGLLKFAQQMKVDLTLVGPELPLTLGIVGGFRDKGLRIFGPTKSAAELEGSKVFAKQFMERHKVPSSRFRVADSSGRAIKILRSGEFSFPVVIKADGLAAGKGVIICRDVEEAEETVMAIMEEKRFGEAGKRVVIEEFLTGKEVSFIVISDGIRAAPLVTTMDYKKVYDGDKGPNTGGMGAISPSPFIDQELFVEVMKTIIFPTITRMLEEGRRFEGVLYAGLMLTEDGPKVLEFNCRFGDPETQPQMLRLESDLVELILAALEGNVLEHEVRWSDKPAGCVIMASGGYPGKYEKGKLIKGLGEAVAISGITIFHAGTKTQEGKYYTSGGRVLGVCASESTLAETMSKVYTAVGQIEFEAAHFRRDIGTIREEER